MKRRIILLTLAAMLLPAMAQPFTAEQPQPHFRSTAAMPASGSAYSATPMLTADGYAAAPGMTAPAFAPSRPRRVPEVVETPTGKQPLGDAALPLLLLAVAYVLISTASRLHRTD